MTVVAIHQPSYFPWLGLLNKIAKADILIILDEVQFNSRGFQHRNLFLDNKGNIKYLTIPVIKKGLHSKLIKDIRINQDEKWQMKHYKFLFFNYHNHPYFSKVFPSLEKFFSKKFDYLIEAVYSSMEILFKFLDIKTKIIFQSEIHYNRKARKGRLILELVKVVGGKVYLSGLGAKNYMDSVLNEFHSAGITVVWNNFKHFKYPQKNAKNDFIEGLSALDLLFNLGSEESRKLFWENVNLEKRYLGI